jgi:hypothetical protein
MVSNNTNKFPYGRMFEIFSAPPSAEQGNQSAPGIFSREGRIEAPQEIT